MSTVVQIVRNTLTSSYLFYDPSSKKAGLHSEQNSANNFIIHQEGLHRQLQVFNEPSIVLKVDHGMISLSKGDTSLHTSTQKTNISVNIYIQGSDGTKYYLRVMPTTRDPDGNGTAKELEEESVALGSGTCNGHESGTGRQNHIKLDLVDEQFIEKVMSTHSVLSGEVEFDILPVQVKNIHK